MISTPKSSKALLTTLKNPILKSFGVLGLSIMIGTASYSQGITTELVSQNNTEERVLPKGTLNITSKEQMVEVYLKAINSENVNLYIVDFDKNKVVERVVLNAKQGDNTFKVQMNHHPLGTYTFTLRGNYERHIVKIIEE